MLSHICQFFSFLLNSGVKQFTLGRRGLDAKLLSWKVFPSKTMSMICIQVQVIEVHFSDLFPETVTLFFISYIVFVLFGIEIDRTIIGIV